MAKANIQHSHNKMVLKYIWIIFGSDTLPQEILNSRS
jgi:hypothetical protein